MLTYDEYDFLLAYVRERRRAGASNKEVLQEVRELRPRAATLTDLVNVLEEGGFKLRAR